MTTVEINNNRGDYGQLLDIPADVKLQLDNLLQHVQNAAKIDEHGGWDFGVISQNARKGQIHTINYDWYAYGRDIHSGQFLEIVQVREFYRRKASYFAQIRKSYFLLGQNEDGTSFAHPVESRVIHSAIKKGKDVVYAVQTWIFGYDYESVLRQGDICLIPVASMKGEPKGTEIVIEGSHIVRDAEIRENGALFVKHPSLEHIPGTHPPVKSKGKYKVVVGKRAAFWSFAKPTID